MVRQAYEIAYFLERSQQRDQIELTGEEHERVFAEVQTAAELFNQAGERARVHKRIEPDSVVLERDGTIRFTLLCEIYLQQPTRSAHYFVEKLIKTSEYYQGLVNSSGRLFKGDWRYLGERQEKSSPQTSPQELTDEQAQIKLVKIFSRGHRELIDQIKEILGGYTE